MRMLPLILVAVAVSAIPAQAREKDVLSWGKAGVSYDAYRSDAVACAQQGYYLDISGTEAVATFKAATKQLDANEGALQNIAMMGDPSRVMDITARSAQIVAASHPDRRFKELRALMTDKVTTCLSRLGYRQFRLTPEQKKQLRHLKKGSPERHAYLYSLGSNPTILADQAV